MGLDAFYRIGKALSVTEKGCREVGGLNGISVNLYGKNCKIFAFRNPKNWITLYIFTKTTWFLAMFKIQLKQKICSKQILENCIFGVGGGATEPVGTGPTWWKAPFLHAHIILPIFQTLTNNGRAPKLYFGLRLHEPTWCSPRAWLSVYTFLL